MRSSALFAVVSLLFSLAPVISELGYAPKETLAGNYTFAVRAVDAKEHASNPLTGTVHARYCVNTDHVR